MGCAQLLFGDDGLGDALGLVLHFGSVQLKPPYFLEKKKATTDYRAAHSKKKDKEVARAL